MSSCGSPPAWTNVLPRLTLAFAALSASPNHAAAQAVALTTPFEGLNVIAAPGHPFGSDSAKLALRQAKELGARAVAVVPFFWQSTAASPYLARGQDMPDAELRAAVRDAHALGLAVMIKPQVWVPGSWAGAVAMDTAADWQEWFADYRREIGRVARIADEEKAEALAIGTELTKTTQQPQWPSLIDAIRDDYHGALLYVAHNIDEAEAVPFWNGVDLIGVTLYPPLGADCNRDSRRMTMQDVADRLDALAARTGKSIVVGEIGLRSAQGATEKPWESAEERATTPDPALQAVVLQDWLEILDRPAIHGVLIWRWLTDPDAGGLADTDFTVQGKPAEKVLTCAWTKACEQREGRLLTP
jgi:hypothetical protein